MELRQDLPQLMSIKTALRITLVALVVMSLLAGFFQIGWQQEEKKYLRLEDKYVRVRDQLGRDETQRLIDESYDDSL